MKAIKQFWQRIRWLIFIPLALLCLLCLFVFPGYEFSAFLCVVVMGIIAFYNLAENLEKKHPKPVRWARRIVTGLLCLGLLVYAATEVLVIRASFGNPGEDVDYIVVLGAKVREDGPSLSLQNRIDAAYAYLTDHPEVIAVVSGGQGPDEPMAEGKCMRDTLVSMGIDPERVWSEEQATSTWENLRFSLDLIQENTGLRPTKIGLVSSEYHLFRAKLLADACGVEAAGIPAHTTRLSQAVNHFLREVAGIWHYILLGGQYSD